MFKFTNKFNVLIIKALLPVFISLILISCHSRETVFLVTSDLHFDSTAVKAAVFDSVVNSMNSITAYNFPGSEKKIRKPFGVVIPGDITNSGKINEWQQFLDAFGLNGKKKLKYEVFESFGNHDGNIDGIVRSGIIERNRSRRNLNSVSPNGLHYSWDRNGVHFVILGSYPGNVWDSTCGWCHYFKESFRDPQSSLAFLENDLKNNLKKSDQPVILFFHYGWDDFSNLWWTPAEQDAFYNVIKDFNIVAIFHGHNHSADCYRWRGISVWGDGSPQRGTQVGSYLIVRVLKGKVSVYNNSRGEIKELRK
jgi:cytolysin (calcineurin-like family phosphatase)